MKFQRLIWFLCLPALSLWMAAASAETIQFPEEELSQESVLPVFDQPQAVKKRLVPFTDRIELEGSLGASLNDPFFNSYLLGLGGHYHLSEIHSFGLSGAYFMSSQSSYVGQISSQVDPTRLINFNNAPSPQFYFLADYEFTPYYGKISLTKQTVMNLTISGSAGVGVVSTTSAAGNDSSMGFSLGLNERFFFTRNLGIKVDLKTLFYQETDVIATTATRQNVINLMVSLGMVYFIPSL